MEMTGGSGVEVKGGEKKQTRQLDLRDYELEWC